MDHECVDEDRDCWCDIFGCQLESGWGPHATTDIDGDNRCELCCRMLEHDCYDMDNDELCDLCHQECSSEEEYLLGDINGDGEVNIADVAKLYAHVRATNISNDASDRYDINGDGEVNIADVAKLYAHVRGTSRLF
jgi:hypothetical protein